MTIETLEKRIAGKQKAIATLEKKIERINAAKATNWVKNPYWYTERDLEIAQKELAREHEALAQYEEDLQKEHEKANSRNVKVLVDFLEVWKEKSIEYFWEEKERYEVAKKEYYAKDHELTDRYNSRSRLGLTREESKALWNEMRENSNNFRAAWVHVTQFNHGSKPWDETMQKDIEIEKNRKYDDIIERTNAIVGQITDASNLKVGAKGDLNGYIIGTRGKAKVQTIGAGGWNIVRFHFRTLIHKM